MNPQAFDEKYYPKDKLPDIDQRVLVLCIKEIIYKGDDCDGGANWLDDGIGHRGIIFWSPINEKDDDAR